MKVKVIQEFRDKFNYSKTYKVGEVADFDPSRAEDIIARKLGVAVIPTPAPAPRKPRVKK